MLPVRSGVRSVCEYCSSKCFDLDVEVDATMRRARAFHWLDFLFRCLDWFEGALDLKLHRLPNEHLIHYVCVIVG
jgi:hypothetical protein